MSEAWDNFYNNNYRCLGPFTQGKHFLLFLPDPHSAYPSKKILDSTLKRERRLFYACSPTALAVHVLARTTGLFNNNAVAYKPTIMMFMDMIQTHDGIWQPGNHVATTS